MKHLKVAKEVYVSPSRLVIIFIILILVIDFGLELSEAFIFPQHFLATAIFDGVILVILLTPAVYLLVFRPMAKFINERKIAEEELRKEKEFSESLIQITNVIVVGLDAEGQINLFSKMAEKATGYTFDELKDKDWFETVVPKVKYPQFWEEFNLFKQSGEIIKLFENPILTKSGTERIISWQNGCVYDDKKAIGIISLGIDVTDRKQAEIEMQMHIEIDQFSRNLTDINELLRLVHQSLKKVLYAENCFFAFYNHDTGLFKFPYFVDQFNTAPQAQDLSKSCTANVFRTGNPALITAEKFQELVENNEIEMIGTASPSWIGVPIQTASKKIGVMVLQHYKEKNIYNEHQLVILVTIANHLASIIESILDEEELQKSNSLLKATLESTADGILVVDKEGKVSGYNHKFVELWRIPESIVSVRKDEALLSFVLDQLKDPEGFISKVNMLYQNDEEISFDNVEFKDGRIFGRYSQAQTWNGKSIGRVWSFRDITDRMKTLQALRESEARLQELNATKDKFFSIIAHDLKSPFNSILGFSEILSEQMRQKDYEGIEEYADIIRRSSERAVDLIMNLMDWTRSQSGRMDFNPEIVEIGALINEVYELSNVSAIKKSIHLTRELPHHVLVYIDKGMITTVLRNLISNAIKFTNPGGSIVIQAEQLGHELKVSVTDNGIGIERENLNKLFRIDESYSVPGTQNEQGTGLGLLLCKEFINLHKGKIWAESEPGKGSSFYFTVPKN